MAKVDLASFELHNVVRRGPALRTRKGLVDLFTPTAGSRLIDSFSVEMQNTGEVLHHLVEQSTTTDQAVLRVLTEEFVRLFSVDLGPLPQDSTFTFASQYSQILVNGPQASQPLYGLVGGGYSAATKVASINPDTTALDVPAGIVIAWGDRIALATANQILLNDPGVDTLRTFTAQNVIPLPAQILDLCISADAALWAFTADGAYSLPIDGLSSGQSFQGFIQRLPSVSVSRRRNAVAVPGGQLAVLQRDHVLLLPSQEKIPLGTHRGKRFFSQPTQVDDLRLQGQIFATSTGFIVGLQDRGFFLHVDLRAGSTQYVWNPAAPMKVVGTLRSRENETLIVFEDRVVQWHGTVDFGGTAVRGVLAGSIPTDVATSPVLRRLTVAAGNTGQTVGAFAGGASPTDTSASKPSDLTLGTDLWSAATPLRGRETRSTRLSFRQRLTDLSVEARIDGGDREIQPSIDIEITGQGRTRRDGGRS